MIDCCSFEIILMFVLYGYFIVIINFNVKYDLVIGEYNSCC